MKKILLALCLMTGTASALVHVGEGDNATLGSVTASSMTVTGAGIVIGGVLQTTAYTGGGGTTGVVSASPQYSIAAFVLPGTTTTVAGLTPGTSGYALFSGGPTAAAYFAPPATITGVTAGTGLSGGGTSGTVTLNVSNVPAATIAAGNLGASVVASSIGVSAVGVAQMNFSGSPNASTFARGDGSWASPAGGSGASSLAVFNGITLISSPTLSVAGDGQSIIAYLIGTSSAGFKVNSASGTLQGNTFNGNSQLVQTNSSGQLPALSATNLTNIPGSQITSGILAANIASGSLGGSVIASSITLGAMYGSPTLNAANITNNITAGSATVTNLSASLPVQTDASKNLTSAAINLSGSQVTGSLPGASVSGNIAGNAANVTGTVPIANGGTGTSSPGIVAGTNVTVTGSWPNQTVNSTGGGSSVTPSSGSAFWPFGLGVNPGGAFTIATSSTPFYGEFVAPYPGIIISSVTTYIETDVAGAKYAWAIYSSTCGLLAQTKTGTGAGVNVFDSAFSSPLTLTAGNIYFLSFVSSVAGETLFPAAQIGSYSGSLSNHPIGSTQYHYFTGANLSSLPGGIVNFPSTCGTRTDSLNNNMPASVIQ